MLQFFTVPVKQKREVARVFVIDAFNFLPAMEMPISSEDEQAEVGMMVAHCGFNAPSRWSRLS
jgi:hypothetical protein